MLFSGVPSLPDFPPLRIRMRKTEWVEDGIIALIEQLNICTSRISTLLIKASKNSVVFH